MSSFLKDFLALRGIWMGGIYDNLICKESLLMINSWATGCVHSVRNILTKNVSEIVHGFDVKQISRTQVCFSLLCVLILDCIITSLLSRVLIYVGYFRTSVLVCFLNTGQYFHQDRAICVCPHSCLIAQRLYFHTLCI